MLGQPAAIVRQITPQNAKWMKSTSTAYLVPGTGISIRVVRVVVFSEFDDRISRLCAFWLLVQVPGTVPWYRSVRVPRRAVQLYQ